MFIICRLAAPRMIQLHTEIPQVLADELEAHFCELEHSPWMLKDDRVLHKLELYGYFDETGEARNHYEALLRVFPQLPASPEISAVQDRDWKEAYKDHFKPWTAGPLHWVPTWERERHPLPAGASAIYLDPGMAFGTGNHETTRLCALRLVDVADDWRDGLATRSVIDAGCGSGILAISAAALGFGEISGFDIDPDSVEIARENAAENGLARRVNFFQGGLDKGLGGRQADLVMANILANVLLANMDLLLDAVKPGGQLILSGILSKEVDALRHEFTARAQERWGNAEVDSRKDGEWADVKLGRKG